MPQWGSFKNKQTNKTPRNLRWTNAQGPVALSSSALLLVTWVGLADDEETRARDTVADPQQAQVRKREPGSQFVCS